MITEEKTPMRVLFFRDHEISGLEAAGGDILAGAVRAAGRAGLKRIARPGGAGVLCGYAAAALAAGFILIGRRDA
jgi:hypothetical protein